MKIYEHKKKWKLLLVLVAIAIGVVSILYTNILVKKLSKEERKKVVLFVEGMKRVASIDNPNQDLSFVFEVIRNNETVPVIVTDDNLNILFTRNLDSTKVDDEKYLHETLQHMRETNDSIKIVVTDDITQYAFYDNSILLKKLFYYPIVQLGIILLFILVSYLAFSSSRKAEQNRVWVGMSKETAHQLGTPISSLMAWLELMKSGVVNEELINDIEKDIKRLEMITERFSKIGSAPVLNKVNISETVEEALNYIKSRTSDKIKVITNFDDAKDVMLDINVPLFEWVIENICKNAVDAMNGEGTLDVKITDVGQVAYIDVKDTGKGIPKIKQKTVFNPGYTTKKRGWGLGLSLTKRIIEEYHGGKIFVRNSEINKGTTFRIVLKK